MGDRANVQINYLHGPPVYLYTHWGGYTLPLVVQRALAKGWRWDDDAYLARIIFDEMTHGEHGLETGFGISTYIPDNEHDIIEIYTEPVPKVVIGSQEWTFDEYINDESIRNLRY